MQTSNTDQLSIEGVESTASGREGALAVLTDEERGRDRPPGRTNRLDGMGLAWSSLCAVHCLAPVALTGTALLSNTHHEQMHHGHSALQIALVGISVGVAAVLLGRAYLLQHRDSRPLWLLALAVAVLVLGHFGPWARGSAAMIATTGGFLVLVTAQVVNIALLRRRRACCGVGRPAESTRLPGS